MRENRNFLKPVLSQKLWLKETADKDEAGALTAALCFIIEFTSLCIIGIHELAPSFSSKLFLFLQNIFKIFVSVLLHKKSRSDSVQVHQLCYVHVKMGEKIVGLVYGVHSGLWKLFLLHTHILTLSCSFTQTVSFKDLLLLFFFCFFFLSLSLLKCKCQPRKQLSHAVQYTENHFPHHQQKVKGFFVII